MGLAWSSLISSYNCFLRILTQISYFLLEERTTINLPNKHGSVQIENKKEVLDVESMVGNDLFSVKAIG